MIKRFLQFIVERNDDFEPGHFHNKLHRHTSLEVLQQLGKNVAMAWKRHGVNNTSGAVTRFGIDRKDRLYASNGFYTHNEIDSESDGGLQYSGYVKPTKHGLIYDVYPGTMAWGKDRIDPKKTKGSAWFKRFEKAGIKRGEIGAI